MKREWREERRRERKRERERGVMVGGWIGIM